MCVEKKKKKKSKKKQRKKKHKNNQHLGHPLSTVGMPPISNIKTSATSSSSTTSSTTITTTSTTMPPWPSTTPWYQMPQTSLTPTRSSSTTTTLTTTTRPTPTPWSTQPSRPPRPLPTTSIPYYHQITPVFPAPFIYCPPDVIKDLPSLSGNECHYSLEPVQHMYEQLFCLNNLIFCSFFPISKHLSSKSLYQNSSTKN